MCEEPLRPAWQAPPIAFQAGHGGRGAQHTKPDPHPASVSLTSSHAREVRSILTAADRDVGGTLDFEEFVHMLVRPPWNKFLDAEGRADFKEAVKKLKAGEVTLAEMMAAGQR